MAYFAELDENNKVLRILKVNNEVILDNNGIEQESKGIQFLTELTGASKWKKTSYNTKSNKYYNEDGSLSLDQSKAFRKNFAIKGGYYDEVNDAFIDIKPYPSSVLNLEEFKWYQPVPKPDPNINSPDGTKIVGLSWDENNVRWIGTNENDIKYYWDNLNNFWIIL